MTNITVINLSNKKKKLHQENVYMFTDTIMSHSNLYATNYAKLIDFSYCDPFQAKDLRLLNSLKSLLIKTRLQAINLIE